MVRKHRYSANLTRYTLIHTPLMLQRLPQFLGTPLMHITRNGSAGFSDKEKQVCPSVKGDNRDSKQEPDSLF